MTPKLASDLDLLQWFSCNLEKMYTITDIIGYNRNCVF